MKKRILCLVLILVLLPAVPVRAASSCISDRAGLLSAGQLQELEALAYDLSEQYRCGIYIVTVDDFSVLGNSPRACAEAFFLEQNLGYGPERDGILLFLSMSQRDYWLLSHGTLGNTALPDYAKDQLTTLFLDDFRDNRWYDGFRDYIDQCGSFLEYAVQEHDEPLPHGKDLTEILWGYGLGLAVGLAIALGVCLGFKAQMKSARIQETASAYVPSGGIRMTSRIDRYTHTTTSRRKIHTDSDSSGSSGGRSSGSSHSSGSGFSGKGGKF